MKARSAPELLEALDLRHRQNIALAQDLQQLPTEGLAQRPRPNAWSALEAVEHVNIWNGDYLPRMEAVLQDHGTDPQETFTSTRIGNFFAASVKPGEKSRKIPTLKKLNPIHRDLDRRVLDHWLHNAERLTVLLEKARSADLNELRIKTVLTSLIRMRLGDVLRMMVYHDWRHLEQAGRAAAVLPGGGANLSEQNRSPTRGSVA